MKRKICVVVTARPSYSRIRTALTAIREHPDLELQLVVDEVDGRLADLVHVADGDGRERNVPDGHGDGVERDEDGAGFPAEEKLRQIN